MLRARAYNSPTETRPVLKIPQGNHLLAAGFLAVALGTACEVVSWRALQYGFSDYGFHLQEAGNLATPRPIAMPHFLYQLLVATILRAGLIHSLVDAGMVVAGISYAAIVAALYWMFDRAIPAAPFLLLAIRAQFLAQPIQNEKGAVIGYFWNEAFHSPTLPLLQPFALLLFTWLIPYVSDSHSIGGRITALGWTLVIAGALAHYWFSAASAPSADKPGPQAYAPNHRQLPLS